MVKASPFRAVTTRPQGPVRTGWEACQGREHDTDMVKAEERDLHVVTDASFPDRKGLCLREQPCAGLGHLSTGCWHRGKGPSLTRSSRPRLPSSCSHCRSGVLPLPLPGLGACPRGCSATVGTPLSWGPGSLQAGFPQGWSESLGLAGLRAVWLAWELLSMSLLSSAQKSEAGPWPFSLALPCLVPRREEPPPPSSPCGAAVAVSL